MYDCGSAGPHVSSPADASALVTAVSQSSVTCIKLQPGVVYSLTSVLSITRTLALVAEEGGATLDGGGSTRLLYLNSAADVALFNLTLQNGLDAPSSGDVRPTQPIPTQRRVVTITRATCAGGVLNPELAHRPPTHRSRRPPPAPSPL